MQQVVTSFVADGQTEANPVHRGLEWNRDLPSPVATLLVVQVLRCNDSGCPHCSRRRCGDSPEVCNLSMIRDSFGQVRRNSRSRKLNPAMKERSMKLSKVCFLAVFSSAVLFSTGELKAYGQAPSDPQIAGIVQAANQIDIDQAKLALKKTSSQQVKEFANQMISDHTNLQKSVSDLAKKLGVAPEDSATSKQLKQQADDETSKLKSLHGNAFDKEYASHEVVFHQAV